MKTLLTRTECAALRGLAIMGIVLHNYCHWLKGTVRENEYTWTAAKAEGLWTALWHPDTLLPLHLLSFFGHYGVPVFLFLSGYGLVKKYEEEGIPKVGLWRFTRYNYMKLFRILIVGFVAFTMLDAITAGMHRYQLTEVVGILGMFANLMEQPARVIWPGPYWYFGLTLQLYLLYRLLLYRQRTVYVVLLVTGCWLLQAWCEPTGDTLERLRYNFIGGMLPFGIGMVMARWVPCDGVPLTAGLPRWGWLLTGVAAAVLTVVMSLHFHSWLWVPAVIIVGSIAAVKLMPTAVLSRAAWLGGISAAIFVSHPMVRKIFIRPYLRDDLYTGLLLYIVATLAVGWLFTIIINKIPKPQL